MPDDWTDWTCKECERVPSSAEDFDSWLAIEVSNTGTGFAHGTFCSQQHAADWLKRPLPDWEPQEPAPATLGDRLFDLGCGAAVLTVVLLLIVGLVATVRFLVP